MFVFSPLISSEGRSLSDYLLLEPFLLTRPWVGKSWGRHSLAVWTQMSPWITDDVSCDVSFSIQSSKIYHNFSIRLFAPFVCVCLCEGCQSQKIRQLSRKLVELRAARRSLTDVFVLREAAEQQPSSGGSSHSRDFPKGSALRPAGNQKAIRRSLTATQTH